MMRVTSVILCAGRGTRTGRAINKILLPINGKPVIAYSLETFEHCPSVDEVMLVAAFGEEQQLANIARDAQCHKVQHIIRGGASRHESERLALQALRTDIESGTIEIILMHDGARPFTTLDEIEQLIRTTRDVGAAILAAPLLVGESVVQVDSEYHVQKSFRGDQIWKAQTPQAFRAPLLLQAYDQAEHDCYDGTDTASSVERIGGHIAIVASHPTHIKITTEHDLLYSQKLARAHATRRKNMP